MDTQQLLIVLGIGLSAGILSGLVGVGGGVVMVPALVYFLHYNQHQAQGTSLAVLTLPVVVLAALRYYQECKKMGTPIDLKIVGLLAVTFLVGGYLGSHIAVKLDREILRKIFAVILFYTAFKMLDWDSLILKWLKSIF